MSLSNLSSSGNPDSLISGLMDVLPLLVLGFVSSWTGNRWGAYLDGSLPLIWVFWIGCALIYRFLGNNPWAAGTALALFGFLGGWLLECSDLTGSGGRTWAIFSVWALIAVLIASKDPGQYLIIKGGVSFLSVCYAAGWCFFLLKEVGGFVWFRWSLAGGAYFSVLMSVYLSNGFPDPNEHLIRRGGNLYIILFNLYFLSRVSAHSWIYLSGGF